MSSEAPTAARAGHAVRAQGLSKCYQVYDRPRDRLKQFVWPRLARSFGRAPRSFYRDFWALRDVSFDLPRGRTLGVIGRNGSGKSTLLQLICGTLHRTQGSVEVNGRVAAMLELGSGFSPEFTGRENVYLNAALLGLDRASIEARFDRIAAFADIGEFLEQPVKKYSSGMFVRLAFAVIAHVDADILIIDEALSVGDVFFVQKCRRFLEEFRRRGGTILFVSHDTASVINLCDQAIWLERGRVQAMGEARPVVEQYLKGMYVERAAGAEPAGPAAMPGGADGGGDGSREFWSEERRANPMAVTAFRAEAESFGIGGARIVDAGFFGGAAERLQMIHGGAAVCLRVTVECQRRIDCPAVGMAIKDRLGQAVFSESSSSAFGQACRSGALAFLPGETVRVDFRFEMPVLARGNYTIDLAVAEGLGHDHVQHHLIRDALALQAVDSPLEYGIGGLQGIRIHMQMQSTPARTAP